MFRPRVLSGYRRLLRARTKLFVGDDRAMAESRIAIKAEFIRNAILTNSTDIEACLGGVDEAETMLLHEIMRGTLNDRGNYEVKIDKKHVEGSTTMNPAEMATIEPITPTTTLQQPGAATVEVTRSDNRR